MTTATQRYRRKRRRRSQARSLGHALHWFLFLAASVAMSYGVWWLHSTGTLSNFIGG